MESSSRSGITRLSCKAEVEKFDGTTSFAIWQVRMMAILTKEGPFNNPASIDFGCTQRDIGSEDNNRGMEKVGE
ncbi:hypothetical protein Patl1_35508 [Pistacia atlantica]|nr:hypothetical protein Patl1_35508 [Pistacia atlantica]